MQKEIIFFDSILSLWLYRHNPHLISVEGKILPNQHFRKISKVFWGKKSNPIIINKPEIENNIESFHYDISKAQKELDWKPEFSFEDMLYDFKIEEKLKNFEYLIEKRKKMNDNM